MSQTMQLNVSNKALATFLQSEQQKGTGIPVLLYSVVNQHFACYNRSLAIASLDGKGAMYLEGGRIVKSYGCGDNTQIVRALNHCGVRFKWLD